MATKDLRGIILVFLLFVSTNGIVECLNYDGKSLLLMFS